MIGVNIRAAAKSQLSQKRVFVDLSGQARTTFEDGAHLTIASKGEGNGVTERCRVFR